PQPALAPDADLSDDRPQLHAGGSEVVLAALAVRALAALHDSRTLELAEALAEQRGGHQRDSALDVVESAAAGERQLADHERRPALGEHLGSLCDRAELAVVGHGRSISTSPPTSNCRFCS